MKLLSRKLFINLIKGMSVLFLLTTLILEAFLTAPFLPFSKWQYVFLAATIVAYFYLYYFDTRVSLAHQQERCMDLGHIWDKEQNICNF